MISKGMAITASNGDLSCGDVEHCMEYVLAKGHAILSNGWLENVIVKMGVCCCRYSRGSNTVTSISQPS